MVQKADPSIRQRRYRERIAQQGYRELLLCLPGEVVSVIDQYRDAQSLSSRSLAVEALIKQLSNRKEAAIVTT